MFVAKDLFKDAYNAYYEMYRAGELCDVKIKCGAKETACHRVVLSSVSRYFKTMFTAEMVERTRESVTVGDIDEDAMMKLIEYAYTAKIAMTVDNVESLMYAASILQIDTVATACTDFMQKHLHPTNCIGVRNFADMHGQVNLLHVADEYILDNFLEVVASDEFYELTPNHLDMLIASIDLNVDSETQVYEAVVKWVKQNVAERKSFLPKLISKVKLPLLPAAYLLSCVETEDLLKRNLECRDYLDEAKYYQMSLSGLLPEIKYTERHRPRKSYSGVMFCVGGRGASGEPFHSIECYDLRKDRWFNIGEMNTRRRHVGVVATGGKLYAIGGYNGIHHLNSGEVFDPQTNKWKYISPMGTPRRGIALASLGGPLYAIGGLDNSMCFNIVERYDIQSDSWSCVACMIKHRGGVGVATLKGYLYAVGGNGGISSCNSVERYDPHLDKWTYVASMRYRRAGAGVSTLNGYLYAVGGFDDDSPLDSVERYDPKKDRWKLIERMSCPRGGCGVTTLGGKLYAVGGHDGTNYLNSVEAYDPITNTWTSCSNLDTCRAGAGVGMIHTSVKYLIEVAKIPTSAAGHL
ncbi:kelch-like protein 8 isoform X2 [Tubulanus polymorphus]|uniref:kelch-like protein 8 isoform X2 n=1 Tax=Tubulanus polymorphus TaxID=672921 RepID=UPI003DA5A86A